MKCYTNSSAILLLIVLVTILPNNIKGQKLAVELSQSQIAQSQGQMNQNVPQVVGEAVNSFWQEESVHDANPPTVQEPSFVQVQEEEKERETFTPDDFDPSVDIRDSFLPIKYKYYDQATINQTALLDLTKTPLSTIMEPLPEPQPEKQIQTNITLNNDNLTTPDLNENLPQIEENVIPVQEDSDQSLEDEETANERISSKVLEQENYEEENTEEKDTKKNQSNDDEDDDDFGVKVKYSLISMWFVAIVLFANV
eukprot:TRINITY_DN467_c0_g1_i4.p2 TRINITY_DN467_c0_g1~~TRINITY_DN467_c0_g1_i4.p2  ORF type:complete len:254 (+),score=48.07 TRINITY_DN467_c0_g1_i4:156-917(+)